MLCFLKILTWVVVSFMIIFGFGYKIGLGVVGAILYKHLMDNS